MDSSVVSRNPTFLCYRHDYTFDGKSSSGFIYWNSDKQILGFLDFSNGILCEKELNKKSRQTLLKNCAETLLESKWRTTFLKDKSLKVAKITGEGAEIRYLVQKEVLPKVDAAEIAKYQTEVLSSLINEVDGMRNAIESAQPPKSPPKRHLRQPVSTYQDVMNKNRRLRVPPAMPKFGGGEDSEQNEEVEEESA